MHTYRFHQHPLYERLAAHARLMNDESRHLRHLIAADQRLADFSCHGVGLFYDYSRQRVDAAAMALLLPRKT